MLRHQRDNRATAKKYREAFADLIVDQVLIEPTRKAEKEKKNAQAAIHKEFGDE